MNQKTLRTEWNTDENSSAYHKSTENPSKVSRTSQNPIYWTLFSRIDPENWQRSLGLHSKLGVSKQWLNHIWPFWKVPKKLATWGGLLIERKWTVGRPMSHDICSMEVLLMDCSRAFPCSERTLHVASKHWWSPALSAIELLIEIGRSHCPVCWDKHITG